MCFIIFSLSPNHFDIQSDDDTDIKLDIPVSEAVTFAKKDFPVPGGPNNKIPFKGFLLPLKSLGYIIGKTMASFNDLFASSKPATSSQNISDFST